MPCLCSVLNAYYITDFIDQRQTAAIVFDQKEILANGGRIRDSGTAIEKRYGA